MQVNIGTVITLKGKKFFCSSIETRKEQTVASEWDVFNFSGKECVNTKFATYISQQTARFEIGDVFTLEWERLWFKELNGSDQHRIFTYHNIRKETQDGLKRAEGLDREAPSGQTQGGGEGSEDRSGARREGVD